MPHKVDWKLFLKFFHRVEAVCAVILCEFLYDFLPSHLLISVSQATQILIISNLNLIILPSGLPARHRKTTGPRVGPIAVLFGFIEHRLVVGKPSSNVYPLFLQLVLPDLLLEFIALFHQWRVWVHFGQFLNLYFELIFYIQRAI